MIATYTGILKTKNLKKYLRNKKNLKKTFKEKKIYIYIIYI